MCFKIYYLLIVFGLSFWPQPHDTNIKVKDNSIDELITAYKEAHKKKDLTAVLGLYYWEGVDERIKTSVVKNHNRYLDYKIINIKVANAPIKEYKPFVLNGIKYKTNLEVTKVLKVLFETTNTFTKEVTIPIGTKDSKYYFVTARPE